MSDPRTKQILEAAETALQAIAVAGGYNYTVRDDAIHLGQRTHSDKINEFPALDVFEAAPLETDYDAANGTIVYLMTWAVEGFLEPGDETTRVPEQQRLLGDIVKAIQADHRLGLSSFVIQTRLIAAETDEGLEVAQRSPRSVGAVWETEFEQTHGAF